MSTRIPNSTRWVFVILFGLGIGVAAFYMWFRFQATSLDGFYVETDGFTDARGGEIASVHFIKVESYDSLKIMRVADDIIKSAFASKSIDEKKKRRFLFHFFVGTDTSSLTPEMVDELAYTNPSIEDPASTLHMVSNGYVIQVTFAPLAQQPQKVESRRTQFFMPRPGVSAQTIK
ncbi:MAG: hypothetical protein NTX15_03075 [Candidatus Kapabacteria bacterium]|nr:hypothetical protein [Candidatus Kapabacteria bacterium]